MKKWILVSLFLAAAVAAASAADPVRAPDGRILPEEPQSLPVAGGVWSFPPAEVQLAAGYAKATAQQIADDAKAKADAAKAAEDAARQIEAAAEAQRQSLASAVAYADEKAQKEAAAKLEAVAAAAEGKEPSDAEKLALLWKLKLSEIQTKEEK